jgi:hypothetical protein
VCCKKPRWVDAVPAAFIVQAAIDFAAASVVAVDLRATDAMRNIFDFSMDCFPRFQITREKKRTDLPAGVAGVGSTPVAWGKKFEER